MADAQSLFLQALQGMGSGAIAGGNAMMQATEQLGQVQQKAAVFQSMQAAQNQIDTIKASGDDEVSQRKQIMDYQSKAMMQIAAQGGNKEQMAAIQNLLPPVPNSAQEAMLQGQATGNHSIYAAGKAIMDQDQAYKLQQLNTTAANQRLLESQTVDDNAAKAAKEQAYKIVGNNNTTQGIRTNLANTYEQAFKNAGVSYNPATKTLMNNATKQSMIINGQGDVDQAISKWGLNNLSNGITGMAKAFAGKVGWDSDASNQNNIYDTIANLRVESKSKLMGARAVASEGGRQLILNNKPKIGDGPALQIKKLIELNNEDHTDQSVVDNQNSRLIGAIKSNSRSMADWQMDDAPGSIPNFSNKAGPIGGQPANTGAQLPKGIGLIPLSN